MKRALLVLLAAFSVAAHAQHGGAGPFSEEHVQDKRLEQIAIGVRVQQNLSIARARNELRYAENRRRCQAALRVAELCGTSAGTFYCDEKGFQPIAPAERVERKALDNAGRYRMERCARDAAGV